MRLKNTDSPSLIDNYNKSKEKLDFENRLLSFSKSIEKF